jgi:hypothetical protein
MINSINPRQGQFKTPFDHITDVNEFVLAARAAWAEQNAMPATPMDEETAEDAAMDFLCAVLVRWIILREPVPVDSRERLTQVIDSMIAALRRLQAALPEDEAELKRELLHLLRRQFAIQKGDSPS